TDIRPHLTDAAGDFYAALGSDCHWADYVLITFRLLKISRDATSPTETPASALRWREDQANDTEPAAGVSREHIWGWGLVGAGGGCGGWWGARGSNPEPTD